MIIKTNDPFDSIGFGVEWLKSLGMTCEELMAPAIMDSIKAMRGDVIIVLRENNQAVAYAVFSEKHSAAEALRFILAQKHHQN